MLRPFFVPTFFVKEGDRAVGQTRRFRVFWLAALGLLAWASVCPANGARLHVDQVSYAHAGPGMHVFFLALDELGQPMASLKPSEISLRLDGAAWKGRTRLARLAETERRMGYAIVFDRRDDLPTSLTLVRQGAEDMINLFGARHPGLLISYTRRPQAAPAAPHNPRQLIQALYSLPPIAGRSALSDGLIQAANLLAALEEKSPTVGLSFLVLLTDGQDGSSVFSLAAARDKLLANRVVFNLVGYAGPQPRGGTMARLEGLARDSGGLAAYAQNPEEIPGLMRQAARLALGRHVLSLEGPGAPRPDGRVHALELGLGPGPARAVYTFTAPEPGPPTPRWPLTAWGLVLGLGLATAALALGGRLLRKK